uniref:Enhancer of zeste2 n=1 Tax=Ascaris lumbricoides TaxID=6252 RepID=A0A0M3I6S7_ASCLU
MNVAGHSPSSSVSSVPSNAHKDPVARKKFLKRRRTQADSQDANNDFETIFANCYEYNRKEDDVWLMCKNIENEYLEKLKLLPTPVCIVVSQLLPVASP